MSKEVIKLSNPISINGQTITELSYTLKLEAGDILAANNKRVAANNNVDTTMKVVEFDTELHLYVGMQAIMKVNPHIDINDLKRLSGADVINLFKIGRSFFMQKGSSANTQQSETSAEPSTPIQEDTTAQN